ncbi:MAG: hypothetical protein ACW97Z_18170, partial [Candidatus Hodarchaeales archaeon]
MKRIFLLGVLVILSFSYFGVLETNENSSGYQDINEETENFMRMIDHSDLSCNYYKPGSIFRDDGITIDIRSRLIEDLEGVHGPMGIYVSDGVDWFIISIGHHFIDVEYATYQYFRWNDNDSFNASQWHSYRITALSGDLNVYVDNQSIGGSWTTQRRADERESLNEVRFGVLWSRSYQATIDWDY